MRIIVVGCGRVGAELSLRMHEAGHDVVVLDQTAEAFDNLRPAYRGRTVQGDVLDHEVLVGAGILQAQGLAAVTNSDAVNAVVAHVARTEFGVPHVVVRSYAPSWLPLHEAFGHQVVSSTHWGAQRIDRLLVHAFARSVFTAGSGEVEVYELFVGPEWDGLALSDVLPEEGSRAVAVTRTGHALLAADDFRLKAGDVLHVAATPQAIDALRRRLERAAAPKES